MGKIYKCSVCNREIQFYEMNIDEHGFIVCDECKEEYYTVCERCDNIIRKDKQGNLCDRCEDRIYSNHLNPYGTKPRPIFKNKKGEGDIGNRYFGLELEYSYLDPHKARYLFDDLYNEKFIYNKSDSSLYGDGVEIVTSPCDYSSIKTLINRMREGLKEIKTIKKYSINAGIHIHVNRNSIDTIDIIKLSYLLNYRKAETSTDRNIISFLSGRSRRFSEDVNDEYFKVGSSTNLSGINKSRFLARHIALNLQNKNTIEFRIFKSSADADTIIGYIDIVNLMISFCHDNSLKNINVNNLLVYMKKNTTNKYILSKLKAINKYYKLNDNGIENNFKIDLSILKGINIKYYPSLVGFLSRYHIDSLYVFKSRMDDDKYMSEIIDVSTEMNRNLCKKIENIYRKYMEIKIRRELQKCA